MTLWPEKPSQASPPPQTRRQARENERTAARRAGTSEPTPAGEIPETTATPRVTGVNDQAPAIPATAFAEPGVTSPSGGGNFENLSFSAPEPSKSGAASGREPFDLLRHDSGSSQLESGTPSAASSGPSVVPGPGGQPSDSAGDRALTRRQLRAMQQAHVANHKANHSPPIADSAASGAFTDGGAAPVNAVDPAVSSRSASAPRAETGVTASPTSVFTAFGAPPTGSVPSVNSTDGTPDLAEAGRGHDDTEGHERRPFTPPTGHWSTAAGHEEEAEPITSRNVGHSTAATTTNALILPSLPQDNTTASLTNTGEILVTGSIDLPRSLGSTGAHNRIDSSDIDTMLDDEEDEFNTAEVAPVRASRAISTHASTRGAIAPPKKRGNTLPVVLMVTAGVLAVGVIGLLIAAYALNIFQ